ncbi:helix-turn-helix domain-containing protein [Ramlibacter sp.]|uniref:helix-turn-helix domain-containing protein n=1 Tax=Ramlibacter sp. TaxID=1917967 RepID=UPI0035B45D0C
MTEQIDVRPAPPSLLAHARCLIVRRVPAGAAVEATVHANAHACFNLIVNGTVEAEGRALPRFFVCGPLTRPLQTRAIGPLLSVSLVVQPWLLPALAGLRPTHAVDRIVPLDEGAVPGLAALRAACEAACVDAAAEVEVWSLLARQAAVVAQPALAQQTLLADGVAAASRTLGCSTRQIQRRYLAAMGLGPAAWRRLTRWEQAARGVVTADALAEVALGHGYADQAHLTRETRTVAGVAPARLRQAAAQGREQWSLRPARVRNVQD